MMAIEPPPTWETVAMEQLGKMSIWQMMELSEARKRDMMAKKAAASTAQRSSSGQQPAQSVMSTRDDNASSLPRRAAAESSAAGPSRSPRRSSRGHPYSRSARGKTSNRSPTSIAATSTSGSGYNDAAQQEAIHEILEVVNQYHEEMTTLEGENNEVSQTAVNARLISARFKEKIYFERTKTDKLVGFLTKWQKIHIGLDFDESHSEEPLELEHVIDEELGEDALNRLKRDFQKVLTKKQFSQLKRRFVRVERQRKRQRSGNSHQSSAARVVQAAVTHKGKGKGKGKEKESDHGDAPTNSHKDKGKGKAKEIDTSALSSAAKKRLVADYLKENPAILSFIEESNLNIAIERSRNDNVNGSRSGGSSSGQAEASGSQNHIPEASGSGTRQLDNDEDEGEHPRKRRKIHPDDKSDPSSPKDSSPSSFLAKTLSFGQRLLDRSL